VSRFIDVSRRFGVSGSRGLGRVGLPPARHGAALGQGRGGRAPAGPDPRATHGQTVTALWAHLEDAAAGPASGSGEARKRLMRPSASGRQAAPASGARARSLSSPSSNTSAGSTTPACRGPSAISARGVRGPGAAGSGRTRGRSRPRRPPPGLCAAPSSEIPISWDEDPTSPGLRRSQPGSEWYPHRVHTGAPLRFAPGSSPREIANASLLEGSVAEHGASGPVRRPAGRGLGRAFNRTGQLGLTAAS
jgi:hypothetical protein